MPSARCHAIIFPESEVIVKCSIFLHSPLSSINSAAADTCDEPSRMSLMIAVAMAHYAHSQWLARSQVAYWPGAWPFSNFTASPSINLRFGDIF